MRIAPPMRVVLALSLAGAAAAAPVKHPFPTDAACAMSAPHLPASFAAGELLEFDLDAIGAKAGTLTMRTLRTTAAGLVPVEAVAQTNTFFSKVRRVHGTGTSFLNPKTLRPGRYVEESTENEVHRSADAVFLDGEHKVRTSSHMNGAPSGRDFRLGPVALDNVGAVYFMRSLPLAKGLPLCFDVFAIRRMWRMSGKVIAREHVSLPIGEFEAWHLQGEAVRMDDPTQHREVHLWVSDDARRLPLVAVGSIDLGAVRATLTAFERPMDKGNKARARKQDVPF